MFRVWKLSGKRVGPVTIWPKGYYHCILKRGHGYCLWFNIRNFVTPTKFPVSLYHDSRMIELSKKSKEELKKAYPKL